MLITETHCSYGLPNILCCYTQLYFKAFYIILTNKSASRKKDVKLYITDKHIEPFTYNWIQVLQLDSSGEKGENTQCILITKCFMEKNGNSHSS